MKKLFWVIGACLALNGLSPVMAAAPAYEAVKAKALQGDYQAQRNLAYGYVSAPYEGQDRNQILGCAWYLVIIESGSTRVHEGDVGNVKVYCGRLDDVGQRAALAQARKLYKRVYKEEASF